MAPSKETRVLFEQILDRIPSRDDQITQLAHLLSPSTPTPSSIIVHGPPDTRKTAAVTSVLTALAVPHLRIACAECITGRHLLEKTLSASTAAWQAHYAVTAPSKRTKCENLGALAAHLERLFTDSRVGKDHWTLVFDDIDRVREPMPTLLPTLVRLSSRIPSLTTLLILTHLPPLHAHPLHTTGIPYISFPAFTPAQLLSLTARSPPRIFPSALPAPGAPLYTETHHAEDRAWLWPRFAEAVLDSLGKTTTSSPSAFRALCERLWPAFVADIVAGRYGTRDFSRLLVAKRGLFQREDLLAPAAVLLSGDSSKLSDHSSKLSDHSSKLSDHSSKLSDHSSKLSDHSKPIPDPLTNATTNSALTNESANSTFTSTNPNPNPTNTVTRKPPLTLPYHAALLLCAAYLASHNPPRTDQIYLSKFSEKRRRRRKGFSLASTLPSASHPGKSERKHRRIPRRLLAPAPFAFERLLAIYHALEDVGEDEGNREVEGKGEKNRGGYGGGNKGGAMEGEGNRRGGEAEGLRGAAGRKKPNVSVDVYGCVAQLVSMKLLVRSGGEDVLDGSAARWRANVGWEVVVGVGRRAGVEMGEYVFEQ